MPTTRTMTRRGLAGLILANAALGVAAITYIPTFGDDSLASGLAGDQATGILDIPINTAALPANTVLDNIAKTVGADKAVFPGWTGGTPGTNIEVAPIETGCFANQSPAPVTARTLGWTRGKVNSSGLPNESAMWTVRAYAAGQGAALITHLKNTANKCGVGVYEMGGLGTDAVAYATDQVNTVVWRRGDVVATIGYQRGRQPGGLGQIMGDAERIDKIVKNAMKDVCVDPSSSIDKDRGRSPYVDAKSFSGFLVDRTFRVRLQAKMPPANWAKTGGKKIKDVNVADLSDLTGPAGSGQPAPDVPRPVEMPDAVAMPQKPSAPAKPAKEYTSAERLDDTDGPGCGWDFTGQRAPDFDVKGARVAFRDAVLGKREKAEGAWGKWFPAMAKYKTELGRYVADVKDYNVYATEVRAVNDIWGLINVARDEYETALGDYEEQVEKKKAFEKKKDAAKETYEEALAACEDVPDGAGEGDVADDDAPVCPPKKADILDKSAPKVGEKPEKPDEKKIVADYREANPVV